MRSSHDAGTLDARIVGQYDVLSPQERRAADAILENFDDLATYRASELAELAGVSKATMSRLVRRLGYPSFEHLRVQLRDLRELGYPVRAEIPPDLRGRLDAELDAVTRVLTGLDDGVVADVSGRIASARRVVVVGMRSSYAIAMHLRQQLSQSRAGVSVVPQPGQSLLDDLSDLGDDDLAIVIAFRRRATTTLAAFDALATGPVPVLLITDPTGRALGQRATWSLECPMVTAGAFDGYAAVMTLVSLLADRVLDARGEDGESRIAALDDSYIAAGEIEPR